ncbi:LysR family transcriptional regulator [Nocardia sp. NPDC052566]|uniref:LysR family transcriptional regulator n=1 Tax=Nocardia sp. NPDC052566 TaxID=3364330 RepID=UPI0037C844D4
MNDERIELPELEVFVALAEELHFGRTATRLGLTQPRVSQLLRALERRIGGRLFERTSRRVEITPLGRRLLRDVVPAFSMLHRAITEARNAAQGLRIGFLGPYASTLDQPIARFRARHPACLVSLVQLPWTDVFGPLRRAEVDLQLCLAPVEQPDITVGPEMGVFPRILAIARTHPLAAAASVDLEELADLIVIGPSSVPPEIARTFWPPSATPTGRPIRRGPVARTEQEMLSTVAGGGGVFVTTAAMPAHFSHPGVAFVPFTGMPDTHVLLAWRAGDPGDKVLEFARLAAK